VNELYERLVELEKRGDPIGSSSNIDTTSPMRLSMAQRFPTMPMNSRDNGKIKDLTDQL
jgi:hypothetical protein